MQHVMIILIISLTNNKADENSDKMRSLSISAYITA